MTSAQKASIYANLLALVVICVSVGLRTLAAWFVWGWIAVDVFKWPALGYLETFAMLWFVGLNVGSLEFKTSLERVCGKITKPAK